MSLISDEEYEAVVAWAEQQEWTWSAPFERVYAAYRRVFREQPPRARRLRMPQGVRVEVGPLMDEKEWDWHE